MIRIAALNDSSAGSSDEEDFGPTREALEAAAAKCYKDAIMFMAKEELSRAEKCFQEVLENPCIEKACAAEDVDIGGSLPQDLALKYSCYKNLGNMAMKNSQYGKACQQYLQAVQIDGTEVALWQRLGAVAIKLRDFELALVAFQEGLNVNPNHWPCVDQLLSVVFILRMYIDCLGLCINTLQRDPGYIKALAFKDKIFEEQPSLIQDIKYFFKDSLLLFRKVEYDKAKGDKFISVCESLRQPHKTPQKIQEAPMQCVKRPLSSLTWSEVALSLIETYDHLVDQDAMNFIACIDVVESMKPPVKESSCPEEQNGDLFGPKEKLETLDHTNNGKEENGELRFETSQGTNASHEGREMLRRIEGEKIGTGDPIGASSIETNISKISSRRQTIELGESQDSFRVECKSDDTELGMLQDRADDSQNLDNKAEKISTCLSTDEPSIAVFSSQEELGEKEHTKNTADSAVELFGPAKLVKPLEDKDALDSERNCVEISITATENVQSEVVSKPEFCAKSKVLSNSRESLVGNTTAEETSETSDNENEVDGPSPSGDMISSVSDHEEDNIVEKELQKEPTVNVGVSDEISPNNGAVPTQGCEKNSKVSVDMVESEKMSSKDDSGQPCEENLEKDKTQNIPNSEEDQESMNINEMDNMDMELCPVEDMSLSGFQEQSEETEATEDSQTLRLTETEAAVNTLQNIMGLQPPGEILGLPENEYHFETEFEEEEYDYFDGGVFEEEDMNYDITMGISISGEVTQDRDVEEGEVGDEDIHIVDEMVDQLLDSGLEVEQEIAGSEEVEVAGGDMGEVEQGIAEEGEGEEMEEDVEMGEVSGEEDNGDNGGDADEEDIGEEGHEESEVVGEDIEEEIGDEDVEEGKEGDERHHRKGSELDKMRSQSKRKEDDRTSGEKDKLDKGTKDKERSLEVEDGAASSKTWGKGSSDNDNLSKDAKVMHRSPERRESEEFHTDTDKETADENSVDRRKEDQGNTENSAGADKSTSEHCFEEHRKRTKRTKRGLERELEQLDYWGRRQARDAKRRKRSLPSKLVGVVEETDFLSWTELLRSFLPSSLYKSKTRGTQDLSKTSLLQVNQRSVCPLLSVEKKNHSTHVSDDSNVLKESEGVETEKKQIDHKQREQNASTAEVPSGKENESVKKSDNGSKEDLKETNGATLKGEGDTGDKVEGKKGTEEEKADDDDDNTALMVTLTEDEEVKNFLLRHQKNGGVLDLLRNLLDFFILKFKYVWPPDIGKLFTNIYSRVRKHFCHGAALCLSEDENRLKRESLLALTNLELLVSLHLASKHGSSSGDQESSSGIIMNDLLEEDMIHLRLMEGRGDIWKEKTLPFCMKLAFLQAQLHMSRGDPDNAFIYLEQLQYDLKRVDKEFENYELDRVHVENDTLIISYQEVSKQLIYLQRSQNLEKVVNHYTEGRYQLVAELIVALFHETLPKPRPGVTWPSRQTQLAIMVDSHLKLGNLKDVVKWGSLALIESVETYNRTEDETQKDAWTNAIAKIMDTMYKALLDLKHGTMDDIALEQRKSLTSTLIQLLVLQLDEHHSADDIPFGTLTPWIIMHRVLVEEEKRNDEKKQRGEGQSPETNSSSNSSSHESDNPVDKLSHNQEMGNGDKASSKEEDSKENKGDDKEESKSSKEGTETLYPSTLFLVTAHDHLGKHSWCCQNEGKFLLYCLDIFIEELQRPLEEQHHQTLYQALEQTTFCLYSHPSKKSKHKHLKDHGVCQIPLSLDRGLQLYKYYLPKEIPEFQSSQIPSIADDVAALFKRLRPLLPQNRMEERKCHMGESTEENKQEEGGQAASNVNPPILKDYYYLLGDYFFKNKEWESAVTYYKLDITNNPDRIDSWAPMALAPKAQLETELNSCDVIEDDKFFDQALQAVKCFQKALELDMYHSNLWVEFGGLVFMVHSHASRLLKQDLNPDISMEMFERLEKIKVDMLAQAQICFKKANEIMEEGWDDEELPDERWLHQYMLGKVAEKQGMNPEVILNHYVQAGKHLHDIRARYPHKINYNNPQENAVEALEMYYRVHAYILKYLHQREGKSVDPSIVKLFTKVLNEVVRQPFALFQENNKKGKDIIEEKQIHKEKEIIEDKDNEDRDIIADPESLRDPLELTEADRRNLKRPLEDAENEEPPAKRGSAEVIAPVIEEMITTAVDHSQEKEKSDEKKVAQDDGSETEKGGSKPKSGENEADKETSAKKVSQIKDGERQVTEEKKDSDQEIEVVAEVNKKQCEELITRCLLALKECLARFPQHYKSLYRLAHYYHLSKQHKDNSKARNYLLGCDYYQRVPYMPVNGLFHEKRIWPQNPKNCNLFHGVWRVPNDEIDRPGSFAAHMYRSVSLVLDVLPYLKDFYTILEIALALKNSPEKDKKYLRDNERELLCEHATQVGLQTMKDKFAVLFKGSSPVHGNRRLAFLIDVYRAFKQLSRHLPHTEDQFGKMLQDAYRAFKGGKVDGRVNVIREAEMFCSRNLNFVRRPAPPMPLVGLHNNPALGPSSIFNTGTQARRGRPPGSGRNRGGRGRGVYYGGGGTGENLAIHHAYRTYENMLQVQAALNRKPCSDADAQKYRRQLQQYQEELLRYWQIPGVSQYFYSALQNSSGGSKLSPNQVTPSAILSTLRQQQQQQTSSAHFQGGSNLRPSLSALASKSKEHGISITSVSSKRPVKFSGSNPRPRLSVTVTPTKQGQPSGPMPLHSREDISVTPIQRSGAGPKELMSSSVSLTHLPKLPAGTTLSRPHETSPKAGPAKPIQSSPLQGQTRMAHPAQRLSYSPMKQRPVTPQSPLARSSQSTTSPVRGRSQVRGIQDYRPRIQNPNVSVVSLGRDMQQKQQQGLPRSITLTPANRAPGRGHNVAIRSRGSFNRGRPGGMDYTKSLMTAARGVNPTQRGGGPRMTAQVRPLNPAQLMKLASVSAKPGNLTGMNMLSRPRGEAPRGRGQVRPPLSRPQQPQVPPSAPSSRQGADDVITLD